jgi:hypothetical protein
MITKNHAVAQCNPESNDSIDLYATSYVRKGRFLAIK